MSVPGAGRASTSPSPAPAALTAGMLTVVGGLLLAQGACLPPIPNVGRPCQTTDDCVSGPFALLSGNLFCVPSDDVGDAGSATGICLLLQEAPADAGVDGGPVPDGGDGDGDGDGGVDPGDRRDPYACDTFAPFVRGLVVALEDGPVVRQPLGAFDLPAPAESWSLVQTTRLGDAELVGAELAFLPASGGRGTGQLLLETDALADGSCADRVVAIDVLLLDAEAWPELIPEDPPGCTATACGRVRLTEDNPNLLAGRTYEGIAVMSGVETINVVGATEGQAVTIETLAWHGAPSSFEGIRALAIGDAPLGTAVAVEGHAPPLTVQQGQELDVTGWLRTTRLTLGTAGGDATATLAIGGSGWLQSDETLLTAGPHEADVTGALVARAGATWQQTHLHVDGALVIGGPWRCDGGEVSFGDSGQIWAAGDAVLSCPQALLPDVWVLPGGRLRLGTSSGFSSFRPQAQLHSRGRVDICRWQQLEAGDAPPPLVLDDGAELVVGTPLVSGQHDALLAGCTTVDGASVSTTPTGACGDPDVTFAPVPLLGTRGVIVGCVGSDACPAAAVLASDELIDAPPGPYRPEVAEVAGGELSAQGFDLAFSPGFIGQRGTARVLSCTGARFGVDIDATPIVPSTRFWRTDAISDDLGEPGNWLNDEGKPLDAAPVIDDDTVLFVLPGAIGPRVDTPLSIAALRVMGGAQVHLNAPLTVSNSALVSGRVVADQNAGELVLTSLGVLPPDGQVAGSIQRVALSDASAPQLTSALQSDQLALRAPDADGLTLFIAEDAHFVIEDNVRIDAPAVSLQLVGPGDGEPTLTIGGTLDLGQAETFGMFNNTIIEVRGGMVCDEGFPTAAVFSGNEQLRLFGDALQPLSCKSPVGALPPQVLVVKRARVQLDGRLEMGVGVTRVGEGVTTTKTLVVNGELLFFGPDLSPQQLQGLDAVVVGSEGRLRFPPDDPGVDLLGGATCTASDGVFTPGQIEGFDAWCDL
jgi:hypothetical protein